MSEDTGHRKAPPTSWSRVPCRVGRERSPRAMRQGLMGRHNATAPAGWGAGVAQLHSKGAGIEGAGSSSPLMRHRSPLLFPCLAGATASGPSGRHTPDT